MAKLSSDGLARLQHQSRIPATTWRQWCSSLELNLCEAVAVWEEVCFPLSIAGGKTPDVAFVLQLRAARPELDIFDFKEDASRLLHFIAFVEALDDPRLTADKLTCWLLQFYPQEAARTPVAQPHFIERFLVDLCSVLLAFKALPPSRLTLNDAFRPIVEGRATVRQMVRLGLASVEEHPCAKLLRECLDDVAPRAVAPGDAGIAATAKSQSAKDNRQEKMNKASFDSFMISFKAALYALYKAELQANSDGQEERQRLLDERFRAIARFKPLQATVPSLEEAQAIARRMHAAKQAGRTRRLSLQALPVTTNYT